MIEIEEIFDKLDWNGRLRCLNFCEVEFGMYRYYGFNNLEEIKEALIMECECSAEEVIDMLYNNQDFNSDYDFFVTNGRYLYGLSENLIEDEFDFVTDNLCNGELRQMIEDEIGDKINY